MTTLYQFIEHPIPMDKAAEALALRALRRMSSQEKAQILLKLVTDWVTESQREETRRVERQAIYQSQREDRRDRRQWRKQIDDLRENHPDEYRRRYTFAGVADQLEEMRRDIKLEVTTELLASSFAVGDGRMVTWGEATADDHRSRAVLLGKNVIGNLTTMLLHEQAVEMIEGSGVRALGELPQAAAA